MLGSGLGLNKYLYAGELAIPKNLVITSTTATTISYAWDASAGVDGYQFGIYEDAACTVLIELITIYGASTATYTWDMTYFQLATDYFGRVYTNFAETVGLTDRTNWYAKFKYLVGIGANSHLDCMFGDNFTCCTSAYQARTSLFGKHKSTPSGGWTNANWSNGIGWLQPTGGIGYLLTDFNPSLATYYKRNDAGIYWQQYIASLSSPYQSQIGSIGNLSGGNDWNAYSLLVLSSGGYWASINSVKYSLAVSGITRYNNYQLTRNNSANFDYKYDSNAGSVTEGSRPPTNTIFLINAAYYNSGAYEVMDEGSISKCCAFGDSTLDSATLFLD